MILIPNYLGMQGQSSFVIEILPYSIFLHLASVVIDAIALDSLVED